MTARASGASPPTSIGVTQPAARAVELSLAPADWRQLLSQYRRADNRVAGLQVATTLLAYGLCWGAIVAARSRYALQLPLSVLAAALAVRLFILQHDCMHGSLFASQRVNVAVGYALSIFTLTPHHRWRTTHLLHHAHSSNLGQRAPDLDIYTMTVNEYRAAPRGRRLLYRIFRHRAVLIGILPALVFLIEHRFARGPRVRRTDRLSVYFTNLGFLLLLLAGHCALGLPRFLAAYLPMVLVASSAGMWLFYVQHHFQPGFWEHADKWSALAAGLRGSSFYDLPRPLSAWTAHIGYHHLHHLDPRIPNYRLRQCHQDHQFLHQAPRLTLGQSLRLAAGDCWDEASGRMVRFAEIDRRPTTGPR